MISRETLSITPRDHGVTLLRLARPEFMNALDTLMGQELAEFFEALAANCAGTRCVVICGEGDRAFSAGGDLKQRLGMSDVQWFSQHRVFERAFRALLGCPVPVIAAVNGDAFGGGCEIVLSCDWAYASTRARFGQPEVRLGIIPGGGGTQMLPRAVGMRRAKEIILTGQAFSAQDALEWGVVNALFPPDELLERVLEIAARVASNAPLAVKQAKSAIGRSTDLSVADGLAFEIEAYNRTVVSSDRHEGVRAFNEKRPPVWTHDNSSAGDTSGTSSKGDK